MTRQEESSSAGHHTESPGARASFDSVARALEPFAHLYLAAGLGAVEFTTAVKLAFVRAAAGKSVTSGKLNISAISVTTGLTRKEIRSLLELTKAQSKLRLRDIAQQRTNRVIQGWRTDPEFLDRAGNPAPLHIKGKERSVEALAKRYAGDVTKSSVLKELERIGAILSAKEEVVQLRKANTRIGGLRQGTLLHMAARVEDLASTLLANAEDSRNPTFTGFREAKALPPDVAAVFIKTFTERSAMLLDSVERWFALQPKQRQGTRSGDPSGHRVGIGVYLVDEPAGSRKPMPPRRQHRRKPKLPAV
jgi:hypothetical protein